MTILRECIPTFAMLSDENRQQLLLLLFDEGELNVNELTERMHLSRPAVSHHLKLLLGAGLLQVRQEGKERYYSVSLAHSVALLQSLLASLMRDMAEQKMLEAKI